jgi:hypothetical protein
VESGTSFSAPQVAGAAAVLIGARPGLSAPQYKSLLLQNTSRAEFASIQQTGSGILDLAAALQSTVTAAPASLSFGIGGGTIDQTRTINIATLTADVVPYGITVEPLTAGPAPVAVSSTNEMAPGETRAVALQLSGTFDPGVYQGFLTIQTANGAPIRIPYWYGVPTNLPTSVQVLDAPTSAIRSTNQTILFRFLDENGLPVTGDANVTAVAGGGRLVRVDSTDANIPGSYEAVVRVGLAGSNIFRIQLGDVSTDVSISVR